MRSFARAVVVTGAAGGIGRAICERFVEAGWHVVGVDASLGTVSCDTFVQADLTLARDLQRVIETLAPLPSLDALVNNAAIQLTGPLESASDSEWAHLLEVNVTVAFRMVKACLPQFRTAGGGAVVNVSSVHAVSTSAGMSLYATSKGALTALTRASAVELAADNVRCNAVLPGAVQTPMLDAGFERSPLGAKAARERLISTTPMKRIGDPAEIAESVLFLADAERSSFITGQCLVVDGGATARLSTE